MWSDLTVMLVHGALLLIAVVAGFGIWRHTNGRDRLEQAVFLFGVIGTACFAVLAIFVWPRWRFVLGAGLKGSELAADQDRIRDIGLKVAAAVGVATAGWLAVRRFDLSKQEHQLSEKRLIHERFTRAVDQI